MDRADVSEIGPSTAKICVARFGNCCHCKLLQKTRRCCKLLFWSARRRI